MRPNRIKHGRSDRNLGLRTSLLANYLIKKINRMMKNVNLFGLIKEFLNPENAKNGGGQHGSSLPCPCMTVIFRPLWLAKHCKLFWVGVQQTSCEYRSSSLSCITLTVSFYIHVYIKILDKFDVDHCLTFLTCWNFTGKFCTILMMTFV